MPRKVRNTAFNSLVRSLMDEQGLSKDACCLACGIDKRLFEARLITPSSLTINQLASLASLMGVPVVVFLSYALNDFDADSFPLQESEWYM